MATCGHGACTPWNTETPGKSSTLGFSAHFSTANQSQSPPYRKARNNGITLGRQADTWFPGQQPERPINAEAGLGCALWSPHTGRWQNSPGPQRLVVPLATTHNSYKSTRKACKEEKKFQSNKVEKPSFQGLFFRLPVRSAASPVQQAPVLCAQSTPSTSMFPPPLLKEPWSLVHVPVHGIGKGPHPKHGTPKP